MALSSSIFFFISVFCCCFLLASAAGHGFRPPAKLFVFGDSYADTGNIRKSLGNSWSPPYGTTLPGKPAGRFSDGRVLTDYLARFLRLKSPLAYELMKLGGTKLQNGMNFAYGGSGVFDTYAGNVVPNMSTQIGYFEKVMGQSLYTKRDLQSSVVLVSLDGNDYGAYLRKPDATPQSLLKFVPLVINQLALDLKRIQGLGAKRIVVTALPPLGCLPQMTQTSSFRQCNATLNAFVNYHNLLLQQAVSRLNKQTKRSTFFILDLYSSFNTVLQQKSETGNWKFETSFKPCCMGINNIDSCGSVDERGEKMYSVCSDPKSLFFWDSFHPSDAGWHAVYTTLKPALEQFIKLY